MSKTRQVDQYMGGQYNLKVGRDHKVVRDFIIWLLAEFKLVVLLCEESSGYADLLKRIPGYTVYQTGEGDERNVALLVKNDRRSWLRWLAVMKLKWYGAKHGRWRTPRSILSVRAARVTWVVLHRVAYQNWKANLKANVEIDSWLVSHLKDYTGRLAMGGDINDVAGSPEIQALTRKLGMDIATEGGIDYMMYKGNVRIDQVQEVRNKGGSDHHPKVWRVTVYGRQQVGV